MWSEKHKPANLEEFHASPKTVEFMKEWDGKPLIIYGGCGVGKTLIAGLTAKDRGWELITVTSENIDLVKTSASTASLFGGHKLFVVDEVDALNTTKVKDFLAACSNPLIFTTRDFSSRKLSSLKKNCKSLNIRKPMAASIASYLKKVCEDEGVEASPEVLKEVAKNVGGDYRAALNDLETLCAGKNKITEADLEVVAARDVKKDIYACLSHVFGGKDLQQVARSTWNIDEQLRDVLFWIDENLPSLYPGKESRESAYKYLSRADIFLGRIMKRQYWGFLRYANPLATCGVNVSRPAKVNYSQYKFPQAWISMSRTKKTRRMNASIGGKLSPLLHVSPQIIARQYIPLFKTLHENGVMSQDDFEKYGLEKEEQEFILGV